VSKFSAFLVELSMDKNRADSSATVQGYAEGFGFIPKN
jgi:hypothetical protein